MMSLSKLGLLLLIGVFSATVQADYQLDSAQSSLHFVSIKKDKIAETHSFQRLSGSISSDGAAKIIIDLASVETNIPIRNERMKSLLLETAVYPTAEVSATLDEAQLTNIPLGATIILPTTLTLDLHGQSKAIQAELRVTSIEGGALLVTTVRPVLLSAFDFSLDAGIQKLMEVANLPSISTAVPVTFTLIFKR
ncbi:MAG: YceI family protein [Cycloclasticus sp.]